MAFVLASFIRDQPAVASPEQGWINALAVLPAFQRGGIGSALIAHAEAWLLAHGCTGVQLGGNLRPFVSGLPAELGSDAFFHRFGFQERAEVWDVASNLGNHAWSGTAIAGVVRPAQRGEGNALLAFLAREFPGRWHYEVAALLEHGGRLSDFMLLWSGARLVGFCQLTFEDSARPIERFFPYQLPRPWGQLGAIGVAANLRGRGHGAALLDAGLRRLASSGVQGCVIDWTSIPDFYARFGFDRYRRYRQLSKRLGPS